MIQTQKRVEMALKLFIHKTYLGVLEDKHDDEGNQKSNYVGNVSCHEIRPTPIAIKPAKSKTLLCLKRCMIQFRWRCCLLRIETQKKCQEYARDDNIT